jgi:DNA-binding IclR family transcriptional regulator
LLQRLVEERMLVRDNQARGYRLGPLVYELGLAALPETNLREAAHPYLQLAAQQTGDMVFLLVRSGFETVCLDQVAGNFAIQTRLAGVGDRHPLGVGAGSLAMLAAMEVEDREIVIGAIRAQLAPYGLDEARLRERIDLAVHHGFALDDGETFPEVAALGLAIRDRYGAPVGAVFVASIRSRMTEGRILEARKRLEACVRGVEAVIASSAAPRRR